MANQQIDSLSLEISIKGLDERDVKNLESLAKSISKLQNSLKKLELNKLKEIEIPQKIRGMSGVEASLTPKFDVKSSAGINKMREQFSELNKKSQDFASNFMMGTNQRTLDLPIKNGLDDLIDKTKLLDSLDAQLDVKADNLPIINTQVEQVTTNTKKMGKELEKTGNKSKKPRKQLNELEKQLRRIKTIAFIKMIRGAMNALIKGMQEGYKNLALFDSQFNETLSTLKTARTQAYNSMALITAPLVEVIAPIVQGISVELMNVANTMSGIVASIKGAATYTKVNTKYMEDYAKSLQKAQSFSFDTFNTLDYQDDSMFETAEVDEMVDNSSDLYSIFSDLKDILDDSKEVFVYIVDIVKGFISDNMGNIREIISQSKEFTDTIKNVLTKINFEKVLKNITTNLSKVIGFVGIILDLVEGILEAATPLIDAITSDLSPALLDMFVSSISPIFDSIKAISPIIVAIVDIISSVLAPILKVISPIISTIGSIVSRISEGIAWLVENYLSTQIVDALKTINTLLEPIVTVVSWLLATIGEIFNMIDSLLHGDWEGFAQSFGKAVAGIGITILKFFAGVIDFIINGVIEAINFVLTPLRETIKAFGGKWDGITWRSNLSSGLPSYANGGIVGEIWQMNEYGNPEMLYNANGNSTAVITQDQLARAFENAIFNTGLLDSISDSKNIYIDGKYVAQSKNFKTELNRTNPNLNIK